MKATITNGELKGVEFELSEETVVNIRDNQIPERASVGQVYYVDDDKRMVVAINGKGVGLTSVGDWPGCFTSVLSGEIVSNVELRRILIETNARYLGTFNHVFETKETEK